MYPWIPQELVANPLGSVKHTLGTTVLDSLAMAWSQVPNTEVYKITLLSGQFTSFCNTGHT